MEDMTITRALVELKTIGKRIESTILDTVVVSSTVGNRAPNGYSSVEEFQAKARAGFESIQGLIKRRDKIKAAIVQSNASTQVKIGKEVVTVAEAIERKNSIHYQQALLNNMSTQYVNSVRHVESINNDLDIKFNNYIESTFSNAKPTKENLEAVQKTWEDNNVAKLVDPLDVKTYITDLRNDLNTFLGEVDIVLSESNSVTKITIE